MHTLRKNLKSLDTIAGKLNQDVGLYHHKSIMKPRNEVVNVKKKEREVYSWYGYCIKLT